MSTYGYLDNIIIIEGNVDAQKGNLASAICRQIDERGLKIHKKGRKKPRVTAQDGTVSELGVSISRKGMVPDKLLAPFMDMATARCRHKLPIEGLERWVGLDLTIWNLGDICVLKVVSPLGLEVFEKSWPDSTVPLAYLPDFTIPIIKEGVLSSRITNISLQRFVRETGPQAPGHQVDYLYAQEQMDEIEWHREAWTRDESFLVSLFMFDKGTLPFAYSNQESSYIPGGFEANERRVFDACRIGRDNSDSISKITLRAARELNYRYVLPTSSPKLTHYFTPWRNPLSREEFNSLAQTKSDLLLSLLFDEIKFINSDDIFKYANKRKEPIFGKIRQYLRGYAYVSYLRSRSLHKRRRVDHLLICQLGRIVWGVDKPALDTMQQIMEIHNEQRLTRQNIENRINEFIKAKKDKL